MTLISPESSIFVAGHRGMVGSAILRNLDSHGCTNIITRSREKLDLTDPAQVNTFIKETKPDIIINAAAKVGGIHANNTYPAEFIYENLASAMNLIHSAYSNGVSRFLFLGSSCIYPRNAPQPMTEECLLTSTLEKTNEAYAIAKISGLKLCEYYRKQYGVLYHSAMPTNLYGPGDNYHPENSHVLPALIRRFHQAKINKSNEVILWGTGKPKREFLHVDDLAESIYYLLKQDTPPDWVNLGTGEDVSISEAANIVAKTVGFTGEIVQDTSKPDGTPRKLLDVTKIKSTGWAPKHTLESGIQAAYQSFLEEQASGTLRS